MSEERYGVLDDAGAGCSAQRTKCGCRVQGAGGLS